MSLHQIRGETVDEFISHAQNKTKNAQARSVAAAFGVWREMLSSDQITFESERISNHGWQKNVNLLLRILTHRMPI